MVQRYFTMTIFRLERCDFGNSIIPTPTLMVLPSKADRVQQLDLLIWYQVLLPALALLTNPLCKRGVWFPAIWDIRVPMLALISFESVIVLIPSSLSDFSTPRE